MAAGRRAKTALVTGSNRGIGFEVAKGLARHGIKVLAGVRNSAAAEAAYKAFAAAKLDVQTVIAEVSDGAELASALKEIELAHGPIDILVNNAAILIDGPGGFSASLLDLKDETLRRTWETNVAGPMVAIRTLLPGMIARGYGRIVNVSSGAGQLNGMGTGFPAYRISKTALNALTRIAADEARSGDIKVNACTPGWVRTEMGGAQAPRSPEQGAETIIWLATLDANGPTGGFFEDKKPIPW